MVINIVNINKGFKIDRCLAVNKSFFKESENNNIKDVLKNDSCQNRFFPRVLGKWQAVLILRFWPISNETISTNIDCYIHYNS